MTVMDDKQRLARQESESTPAANANPTEQQYIVPDLEPPEDAPPAYGDQHDQVQFSQPGISAGAAVTGMLPLQTLGGGLTDDS